MAVTLVHGRRAGVPRTYVAELLELWRVLLVAGLLVGVVIIGIGSRAAMFLLRVTSSDHVVGMVSDDGFVIGQFTLSGSYNLVQLGAVVGVIGAAAYVAVAPWLIGPTWFRRFTVGVTAGLLVGSTLLHSDGVDFVFLGPLWFAVVLFVGLPVVSGVVLAWSVDAVAASQGWATRRPWNWLLPLLLAATVPLTAPFVLAVLAVVALLLPLRSPMLAWSRGSTVAAWVIRAGFLVIPMLSAFALARDLRDLFSA
jgi:hypothetical protein